MATVQPYDKSTPRPAAVHNGTLIFVHLPKTGGTTLNRIIDTQYNPLRIYSIPGRWRVWSIEKFKKLPDDRRRRLHVLKGHMEFGLHRYLSQPTTYLTMLREPVNQIISSYYYALSDPFHPLHRVLVTQRISLEQFLDLAPWGNNLQTKLIGGIPMAEVNPPQALETARRGQIVASEHFAGRHCTHETLETAKQNLECYFAVVGLTESFDESLALMQLVYGWQLSGYQTFRRSQKRPTQTRLSAQLRARIERYNAFDLELYDYGQRLFNVAVARYHDDVQRALQHFDSTPTPRKWHSNYRAAAAWVRFAISLIRSAT